MLSDCLAKEHQEGIAPDGQPFRIFTLTNAKGMKVQFMDWGATWISCQVPVGSEMREVLLGCQVNDYPKQQAYLGASIGRYANRIANSQFELNGKGYLLAANQNQHQLHGGQGFDRQRWYLEKCGGNSITFSHFSHDGDQGFPGNMHVFVTYSLSENNKVKIEYEAICDQDCPINLTNHAYFNLNNAVEGCDIRGHSLQLNADYFLPVDSAGIPNAELKSVEGTSFDFREEKPIGLDFLQEEQQLVKGYDHSFLLNQNDEKTCAILTALDRSLTMKVTTSQPALQVYTGNFLSATPNRQNGQYADYAGIALETQCLPDTPNHPEWWKYGGITKVGEKYYHWTKYQFIS
ncbi:galactose-1-epimerase [Canicola haemoglobinophilus]|uniref:Aldose 1-epimerase n=1 Tax=Canicola haemoglobinophilus TaxID=733 RepID=A0A1V4B2U7_9PAST|nr:galactose-1-epimerase [Canicola haemoglobinophilus]OOS01615.1 galactose-1-epimerase [Canicola haemoglobinophilus]STO55577.1 aldose 1-epimerase [Canicola haemoglobinophilus]STO58931.1 aldose 1-epimerase [Canicola haemoglobinophilus]STO67903.1 aldose 1-epimerase [Canicola haemoglobinophilus]